jgi:hypothetical protein
VDLIRDVSDRVGRVFNELNSCVDAQDVQINQLANMVNNLVGKVKGQSKEIKSLKLDHDCHCKVINTLTMKIIALEQYTKDIQKKVFPQVGGGEQLGFVLPLMLSFFFKLLLSSLVSKLLCFLVIRWWPLSLPVDNAQPVAWVLFMDRPIIRLIVERHNPPVQR